MKRYGYARVSTEDQSLEAQRAALQAAGCDLIIEEKASGKDVEGRPKLALLIEVLGAGDQLIVTKLDRLARSTLNMLELVEQIGRKGAGLRSLAETWCDTTTPAGRLIITVFGGVAQFERERMKERQREGIAEAKKRGAFKGGTKRFDNETIRKLSAEGLRPSQIRTRLGCSFDTISRALKGA
jgi:DNA invertase Pin-like site-specific DNA recombinase